MKQQKYKQPHLFLIKNKNFQLLIICSDFNKCFPCIIKNEKKTHIWKYVWYLLLAQIIPYINNYNNNKTFALVFPKYSFKSLLFIASFVEDINHSLWHKISENAFRNIFFRLHIWNLTYMQVHESICCKKLNICVLMKLFTMIVFYYQKMLTACVITVCFKIETKTKNHVPIMHYIILSNKFGRQFLTPLNGIENIKLIFPITIRKKFMTEKHGKKNLFFSFYSLYY